MIKIETVGKPYMRYLAKVIPLAFDESMSYYEQILSLLHYLKDEVMPVINNNAEAVVELQNLFNELKDYVDNYFDNLDIQEEVDNKLEEMYENGQLQSLIEEFIELSVTFTYNTVAEMKEASNLVNGSFVKTNGFYEYNDGGSALYKVRTLINTDVVDEILLIALDDPTLVAELMIQDEMNVKQYGAKDDNTTDNSTSFIKAFNNIKSVLNIYGNTFKLVSGVALTEKNNLTINFNAKLHMASSSEAGTGCITLRGCKNIEINNPYIYSERDKPESPLGSTTRVTELGSNINGFVIRSCEEIYINNSHFENMANDFRIADRTDIENPTHSKNIYIDKYYSLNASLNSITANSDYVYFKNANLTPAIELGSGDHCFYLTGGASNIYLENINFTAPDVNFGIFLSSRGDTTNGNIFINNCNITAKALYYTEHGNKTIIENTVFNQLYVSGALILTPANNGTLIVKNCEFNNIGTRLFNVTTNGTTLYFDNNIVKMDGTHEISLFQGANDTTSCTIRVSNSRFYNLLSYLVYVGTNLSGYDIIFRDCYIETKDGNLFSKRNGSAKLMFSNSQIIKVANAESGTLYYNGGLDSTNTTFLNVYILGYQTIANSTAIANLVKLNSYWNNTLIS